MSEPMYPPNSHKYKEEQKNAAPVEKRVQRVAKGPVKTKTNELRKFTDIFISEDVTNVKNYIFMDVLVPAVKKAIYDIVTNGIDMFLYGGTGKGRTNSSGPKVSYRNYYDQKNTPSSSYRGSENTSNRNGFDYEDIVFSNRGDAEMVKQQMRDVINRYGVVTIADMYDMADPNLTPPYTSHKYGWMDVSSAEAVRVRDGYILKLPRAVPVDYGGISMSKMPPDLFQALLDELDANSLETLKTKNARYATNGDSLHNFRKGAAICGGTPAQACWGYVTKHLVALSDMVQNDDFSNREDFLEKCQDIINYVRFLWCIGNDKTDEKEND